jgi:hypothetical protein
MSHPSVNIKNNYMQKSSFLPVSSLILLTGLFFACSGNGQSGSPSATSVTSGGATYSAVIDGKTFSGTTTNGAAKVSLEQNSTSDGLSFQLGYADPQKQGFQFVIKNSGTTDLRKDNIITVCNYRAADGTLYIVDSATVTLNAGTGARTVGTFSGRWMNAHYGKTPADAPETIQVTDGKFDLP